MKTLKTFILESFNDSILKQYFAFANRLDNESKQLLTAPILRTSKKVDLHNVTAGDTLKVGNAFTKEDIKKYFDDTIKSHSRTLNKDYHWTYNANFFIIKITNNDIITFALCCDSSKYDEAESLKDMLLILPDNVKTNKPNYGSFKASVGCTKLANLVKKGVEIEILWFSGDGNNDYSALWELRSKRKLDKEGTFENTEEFLSYYKDKKTQERLLRLINNATANTTDYKQLFDDAKASVEKLFKIIDIVKKNGGMEASITIDSYTSDIDYNLTQMLSILNDPTLYTDDSKSARQFNEYLTELNSLKVFFSYLYRVVLDRKVFLQYLYHFQELRKKLF